MKSSLMRVQRAWAGPRARPLRTTAATFAHSFLPTAFSTTAKVNTTNPAKATHFDYLVIGAGSGGMASARRAADLHGAKVAVVESGPLGGTCVNVGCVPKKIMWSASEINAAIRLAPDYGFDVPGVVGGPDLAQRTPPSGIAFNWSKMKAARDAYLVRLNGIYERNLENSGVEVFHGRASFCPRASHENKEAGCAGTGAGNGGAVVQIRGGADDGVMLSADHVLVATGGYPTIPQASDVPGASFLCTTSDNFFEMDKQPRRVAVVGAGYIAVELAGVMAGLGSEVSLFIRGDSVLRSFDDMISSTITKSLEHDGVTLVRHAEVKSVSAQCPYNGRPRTYRDPHGQNNITLTVSLNGGKSSSFAGFDEVIYAIGRSPAVEGLGLEHVPGVHVDAMTNHIQNDAFSNTGAQGVYALGDVCGFWELTPVAIAAGRRLADRLFGGPEHTDAKLDYELIPTVVFSHPPVGTIGATEVEAREKYGDANVKCYTSTFVNLHYGIMDTAPKDKPRSHIKLVCEGVEERVVGLHVVGMGADEMLQGFGVAMKMGATKKDFDSIVAIHPTAAEEVVTLAPWGI